MGLVGILLAVGAVSAQESAVRQDANAIEVLKSMSAYTASLDRFMIGGVTLTDARLGEGLMVSNSVEVKALVDRPGSLRIVGFDGVEKKELYFHNGTLTVFNSARNFYAQASVPEDIDAAMEFALEELEVEAPFLDLIHRDPTHLLSQSEETILYLTDKARIAGVDCHHIAIRGPESDVQLWVEEGDRPLPRKIIITSKWEGGSPRYIANLAWETEPEFKEVTFEFRAPEGAENIGFAHEYKEGGE
jgi:hypothetical protein